MKDITFERETLYEEVWSTPLTTLAKKYAMSDNGIRKVCKAMNIPLPLHGHWAKVAAGNKVAKAPLLAKAVAEQLNDVFVGVWNHLVRSRVETREREARHRHWQEDERRRPAAEERRRQEAAQRTKLLEDAAAWQKAGLLRHT